MESRIHPKTGETLRRDVRTMTVRSGSASEEVAVPGWYPTGEGDAIHTGADLLAYEKVLRPLRKTDSGE